MAHTIILRVSLQVAFVLLLLRPWAHAEPGGSKCKEWGIGTSFLLPEDIESVKSSQTSSRILTTSQAREIRIWDIRTGVSQKVSPPAVDANLGFRAVALLDLEDPAKTIDLPGGSAYMRKAGSGQLEIVSKESVCATPTPIAASDPCEECRDALVSERQKAFFSDFSVSLACSEDYSPAHWSPLLPDPKRSPITEQDLRIYLLKWEKHGGFEATSDLPVLLGLLSDRSLTVKYRDSLKRAFPGVLAASPVLYSQLLDEFPHLTSLLLPVPSTDSEPVCANAKDKQLLAGSVAKYVEYMLATVPMSHASLEVWESLAPLSHVLRSLPAEAKDEYFTEIAQRVADHAISTNALAGVFSSKAFQFTGQAVAPLFGLPSKSITDISLVRNGSELKPIILSTEPLVPGQNTALPPEGFFFTEAPPIQIPKYQPEKVKSTAVREIRWRHGEHEFKAQVKVQALKPRKDPVIPLAPDYASLGRDGELRWEILGGYNLGSADAKYFMDEYLQYFTDNDFKFGPDAKKIKNLKNYLKQEISSGKADYLIKESHSGGDENNLVEIPKEARLLEGTKTRSDGKKEIVHLIYPDMTSNSELVSNKEFGSWLEKREKAGSKAPLVYLNRSCFSSFKAVNELSSANSRLLTDIPATDVMYFFLNTEDSSGRILLNGFRNEKSYSELRKDLKKNKKYREERANGFIFPDEPEYKSRIWDKITKPVATEVEITDQNGAPYTLIDALRRK